MLWCKDCGQAVSEDEAVKTNEYLIHGEVDDRRDERFVTYHCPTCMHELIFEADRCACGRYKDIGHEYCDICINNRDDIMAEAKRELDKTTERLLSSNDLDNLMASWFE